jgi:hypothetical protein
VESRKRPGRRATTSMPDGASSWHNPREPEGAPGGFRRVDERETFSVAQPGEQAEVVLDALAGSMYTPRRRETSPGHTWPVVVLKSPLAEPSAELAMRREACVAGSASCQEPIARPPVHGLKGSATTLSWYAATPARSRSCLRMSGLGPRHNDREDPPQLTRRSSRLLAHEPGKAGPPTLLRSQSVTQRL